MVIQLSTKDFDVGERYRQLADQQPSGGAIVQFIGRVRDMNLDEDVRCLELTHYPGMTEKVLAELLAEAMERWDILDADIYHRVGRLLPGDQIVYVGVVSPHRAEAYACCEFLMDKLKTEAPFWKKEHRKDSSQWLAMKEKDRQRADRWRSATVSDND